MEKEMVNETLNTVVVDGFDVDTATGEIVGLADRQAFEVTDEASAEWVLEKIMDAEVEAARHRMKLKAIADNLESQAKAADKRAEWLRVRFGHGLEAFARTRLEGQKCKTLKLTYGSVGFRTVKGGLRVTDPALALEVAVREGMVNAVKTTSAFQISLVTDDQRERLTALSLAGAAPGFDVKPDTEAVKIETGVGK